MTGPAASRAIKPRGFREVFFLVALLAGMTGTIHE